MASGKYTKCNFGQELVIRVDGGGHYYLIPLKLERQFVELLTQIEESDFDNIKAESKFLKLFDEHRLSGGYQEIIIKDYRKR